MNFKKIENNNDQIITNMQDKPRSILIGKDKNGNIVYKMGRFVVSFSSDDEKIFIKKVKKVEEVEKVKSQKIDQLNLDN